MREQTLGEAVGLEIERREKIMSAKADWEKWIKHIESHPRTADKYASDIWANNTIATLQARIEALEKEQSAWRKFTDEANRTLEAADKKIVSLLHENERLKRDAWQDGSHPKEEEK